MEIKDPTLHQKLIEMCDCYMETDHLAQMRQMAEAKSGDVGENAVKFLALAILHAVSHKGEKLSIKKKKGEMKITLKIGDKVALPVPAAEVVDRIFATMAGILHLEGGSAEMPLTLGLRNDSIEAVVKMEQEGDEAKLKFRFPRLG